MKISAVAVYCGSTDGTKAIFRSAAEELGRYIAQRHMRLVYGGSAVGNMKTLADTVLAHHGKVTGVFPKDLAERIMHGRLTETIIVKSMWKRKLLMLERADAVIALPGGVGTLDELFDAVTQLKLHIHNKPCGILNIDGFYDPLLAFLEHAADCGYIQQEHRHLIQVATTPAELFGKMEALIPDHQ